MNWDSSYISDLIRIFRRLDPNLKLERRLEDGQFVRKKQDVLRLDGRVSAILTGDRPALNFLGRLSGIATLTHQFVQQLAATQAKSAIREKLPLGCGCWKNMP